MVDCWSQGQRSPVIISMQIKWPVDRLAVDSAVDSLAAQLCDLGGLQRRKCKCDKVSRSSSWLGYELWDLE